MEREDLDLMDVLRGLELLDFLVAIFPPPWGNAHRRQLLHG